MASNGEGTRNHDFRPISRFVSEMTLFYYGTSIETVNAICRLLAWLSGNALVSTNVFTVCLDE